MRSYWLPSRYIVNKSVTLDGEYFRHICQVCHTQKGDKIEIFTDHFHYLVEITEITKKQAQGLILQETQSELPSEPHLHLALSVCRFPTLDLILEKSVEMGVFMVHPFFSDNSFIKAPQIINKRKDRFEKIIEMASGQSRRSDLMSVDQPMDLEDLLVKFNQTKEVIGLFPYEGVLETSISIKEKLESLTWCPKEVWIFVGSEGGFSLKEVELFKKFGLEPLTLGNQVLRVETACLTLLSVIKYHFNLFTRSCPVKMIDGIVPKIK